jgi:hypothetical protein
MTLYACPRELQPLLDIAKIADVVVLAVGPDESDERINVDSIGAHFVTCLKAQGVSSVIGVVQGFDRVPAKKHLAFKKAATQFFHSAFEDEPKVLPLDEDKDVAALHRWMTNLKIKGIRWRDERNYLLAEYVLFRQTSPTVCTLDILTTYYISITLYYTTHISHISLDRSKSSMFEKRSNRRSKRCPIINITWMAELSLSIDFLSI